MKNINKKGVSPVIATVLLISIVIVLAGIIFVWAQGFIQESVQKQGEPVERACDRVLFEAAIFDNGGTYHLDISNDANVPLYSFNIKLVGEGDVDVRELTPTQSLGIGQSVSLPLPEVDFPEIYPNAEDRKTELLVIPIIRGSKGDQILSHECEDAHGQEVSIS